jgi:hypothetical protein
MGTSRTKDLANERLPLGANVAAQVNCKLEGIAPKKLTTWGWRPLGMGLAKRMLEGLVMTQVAVGK